MGGKMENQRRKDIWKKVKKIALILTLICSILTIYNFIESKVNTGKNKVVMEVGDVYKNEENEDVTSDTIKTGDKSPVIQGDGNTVNYIESELETDKPKSVAVLKDISLEYLSAEDDRINNIYAFDLDSLSGEEKKYYLDSNCCTNLLVSNNSKTEYQITRFKFCAENISRDLTPYFLGLIEYDLSDGLYDLALYLYNDGWGDAHNIKLELVDENDILLEYFKKEDLTWEVEELPSGEETLQKILSNDMLLKYPDSDINIYPELKILCNETQCVLSNIGNIYITPQGIGTAEIGASGPMAYGIFIDTSSSTYTFEEDISENIKSNGLIDMPICFFADMSCDMDFYIELEIFDGSDTFVVRTESKYIHLRVSHSSQYWNFDGREIDGNSSYYLEDTFISYPFIKNIPKENIRIR